MSGSSASTAIPRQSSRVSSRGASLGVEPGGKPASGFFLPRTSDGRLDQQGGTPAPAHADDRSVFRGGRSSVASSTYSGGGSALLPPPSSRPRRSSGLITRLSSVPKDSFSSSSSTFHRNDGERRFGAPGRTSSVSWGGINVSGAPTSSSRSVAAESGVSGGSGGSGSDNPSYGDPACLDHDRASTGGGGAYTSTSDAVPAFGTGGRAAFMTATVDPTRFATGAPSEPHGTSRGSLGSEFRRE